VGGCENKVSEIERRGDVERVLSILIGLNSRGTPDTEEIYPALTRLVCQAIKEIILTG
jgi:hypothetical protein